MGIDIADNYSIIIVQERKGKEMTEKKRVWVIRTKLSWGQFGYWNAKQSEWVADLSLASRYNEDERNFPYLPLGGEWSEVLQLGNSFKEINILEETEPEYRFVLVNDQTGERTDLSTEFVSDYNLDDDGSCPDVWSSDAAQDEALTVLGYSVKIVKKLT
jgi:hypothetical protein